MNLLFGRGLAANIMRAPFAGPIARSPAPAATTTSTPPKGLNDEIRLPPKTEVRRVEGQEDSDTLLRVNQLRAWGVLAKALGKNCKLAANIAEVCDNEAALDDLLANTFAQKSTNTLSKRASSLGLYLRWASSCGISSADLLT